MCLRPFSLPAAPWFGLLVRQPLSLGSLLVGIPLLALLAHPLHALPAFSLLALLAVPLHALPSFSLLPDLLLAALLHDVALVLPPPVPLMFCCTLVVHFCGILLLILSRLFTATVSKTALCLFLSILLSILLCCRAKM